MRRTPLIIAAVIALHVAGLMAHSGPPYPLLKGHVAGAYLISVWTDPDATDDGSPGGQFWVTLEMVDGSAPPADTRARVKVRPLSAAGEERAATAQPVDGDATTLFAAVVLEKEGPYRVRVDVSGGRGDGAVEADVDATYDTRPPAGSLVLYLMPFVLAGGLWLKLLLARRRVARQAYRP